VERNDNPEIAEYVSQFPGSLSGGLRCASTGLVRKAVQQKKETAPEASGRPRCNAKKGIRSSRSASGKDGTIGRHRSSREVFFKSRSSPLAKTVKDALLVFTESRSIFVQADAANGWAELVGRRWLPPRGEILWNGLCWFCKVSRSRAEPRRAPTSVSSGP